MARPTLPSYGDAPGTSDSNGWVAVLKAAIFDVSDRTDSATSSVASLTTAVNGKATIDDSSNLSTASPSSTTVWSSAQQKLMILGLINDATTTATNRTWSAQKIVSYVAANAGGGGGAGQPTNQWYEVPASALAYTTSTSSEATKLAAINQNSTTVRNALINYGNVKLPPGTPPLLQVDLDEMLDSTLTNGASYSLTGPAALTRGTRTSSTDTNTSRITAKPILRIRRKAETVFTPQNLRNTVQIGPNLPNPGSVFTSICSGFEVPSGYNRFKSGQIIHLCSNDNYDGWATRAGYSFIGRAAMFPVAGILITITNLSYSALDTALSGQTPARTSGGSLERFTIVGATSGATAIIAGDIAGVNQVVADNVSADFTSGETLRETTTNAVVGTFGGATVVMSGLLNTTYPTTPQMRIMARSRVDVSGLEVFADGDPDDLVLSFNRTDVVNLIGCTDVNFRGVKVNAGYAAGIVTRSCWNVMGDIECHALPNHAIEAKNSDGSTDTKRVEGAYGYVWRALGATDHFDVKVNATFARHAVTSNGIGATWNQDERTGSSSGSADLCTNYWNHGPGGRNGRVTGIARSMLATGWDTHEGAEDWLFDTPMTIEPLSAAKNTTAPDGITLRGFNLTVLNPYFDGVRLGVYEQAVALGAGFVWQNRILGGVIKNAQLGGYLQNEDADVDSESRFLIKGTTIHCNPAIPSSVYAQYAISLKRANTRVEDVRVESVNDRFFRMGSFVGSGSTGVGVVSFSNITVDFTDSTASRIFSIEQTYQSVSVSHAKAYVNPVQGAQKPLYWFVNQAGNTPVLYRGLVAESLTTPSAGTPALQTTTGGSPTFTYWSSLGEGSGGGSNTPTHNVSVAPTPTAQAGAGTGPTVALASGSTDVSGEVRTTTGTAPASGAFVSIAYGTAFATDVFPVVSAGLNLQVRQIGVTTHSATGFTVQLGSAPAASTDCRFTYYVPGV